MDIQYNSKCYTIERFHNTNTNTNTNANTNTNTNTNTTNNKGLFDSCVDATYIIHLEGNGRLPHIHDELSRILPTSTIYITKNKGYKKCKKKLIVQTPYQDLTDAFLQCFAHADKNGHENILILEDDFIFSTEITNPIHLNSITDFISQKKGTDFIYYLGCIPVLIFPKDITGSSYSSIKSLTTHSIIYSKEARSKITDLQYKHWDIILEKNIQNRYLYYIPLCYQLFPETENKKTWSDKDNAVVTWIKNTTISGLGMDKEAEFGFSVLYWLSKIIFLVLFICIVTIFIISAWYLFGKQIRNILKVIIVKNH